MADEGYGTVSYVDVDTGRTTYNPRRRKMIAIVIAITIVIAFVVPLSIGLTLGLKKKPEPEDNTVPTLTSLMSIDRLMNHLQDLEKIAAGYNNSRAVELGYNASVSYVFSQLANTNYHVWIQNLSLPVTRLTGAPIFQQFSPADLEYEYPGDYGVFSGWVPQGTKMLNGTVSIVENLGCEASDYVNFVSGSFALISRGNCTFQAKVDLAAQHGATAALIYNNPTEQTSFASRADSPFPVLGLSYFLGIGLKEVVADEEIELSITISGVAYNTTTLNVIAESRWGNPNATVVIGAHLDSVPAGPGINDDGSGTTANLELALQLDKMAKDGIAFENRVRFGWWAAEEVGLVGSTHYVNSLSPEELKQIVLYFNLDMIGSPNFYRGIYNGSEGMNGTQLAGTLFAAEALADWFEASDLVFEFEHYDNPGRSDYAAFAANGIPATGLFTGAEQIKTPQQRQWYGGLANAAYDPCYHQPCDTVENINQAVLLQMTNAIASTLQYCLQLPNLKETLDTGGSNLSR